mgnify:CR=1 FL=1
MKIGFIGFGNMAEAIITGMISSGNYQKENIGAFDPDTNKLTSGAERLGITAYKSNENLVSECECVVLAVKPIALQEVLQSLKGLLCKVNPLVISIAAGQSIERLRNYLGYDAKIVRVMPNINAIATQAVSGYCVSENVTENDIELSVRILDSFGTSVKIDEEKFSVYSAVAGCSPAYIYVFMDALARVGVKYGLTKKDALDLVSDTVIETLKNSDNSSENKELDRIVLNAIEAAYNKDKGM